MLIREEPPSQPQLQNTISDDLYEETVNLLEKSLADLGLEISKPIKTTLKNEQLDKFRAKFAKFSQDCEALTDNFNLLDKDGIDYSILENKMGPLSVYVNHLEATIKTSEYFVELRDELISHTETVLELLDSLRETDETDFPDYIDQLEEFMELEYNLSNKIDDLASQGQNISSITQYTKTFTNAIQELKIKLDYQEEIIEEIVEEVEDTIEDNDNDKTEVKSPEPVKESLQKTSQTPTATLDNDAIIDESTPTNNNPSKVALKPLLHKPVTRPRSTPYTPTIQSDPSQKTSALSFGKIPKNLNVDKLSPEDFDALYDQAEQRISLHTKWMMKQQFTNLQPTYSQELLATYKKLLETFTSKYDDIYALLKVVDLDLDIEPLEQKLRPLEIGMKQLNTVVKTSTNYVNLNELITKEKERIFQLSQHLIAAKTVNDLNQFQQHYDVILDNCDTLADELDQLESSGHSIEFLEPLYNELIENVSHFESNLEVIIKRFQELKE